MRRMIVALIFVFATACSNKPDIVALSAPSSVGELQKIYVTTSRLPSTVPVNPRQDRNAEVRYARFDVSIPPTHQLGQIEWPRGAVDPRTDFSVVRSIDLGSSKQLIGNLAREPSDDVTVFVHGFNVTSSEALYRLAQVGHDFQITAPKVLFAWPSAGQPTGYVYDRDSVLFSRDPLANLLTDISRLTDKRITLIAHSMGSHLTMEVLRQLAITGRKDVIRDIHVVVLLSPDIDPDLFRSQANAIGKLPDPTIIMSSRDDGALRLSSIINIGRQKVGSLARAESVSGLGVILFDFTELADGSNRDHLVPFTSPTAIAVLRDLVRSDERGAPDLSRFEVGIDGVIRAKPANAI